MYYGCIFGLITLPRQKIKEKIIKNSEIVAVLREDKVIYDFVSSVYEANYNVFFEKLVILTEQFISKDEFMKPHREYLLKKIRIVIYT